MLRDAIDNNGSVIKGFLLDICLSLDFEQGVMEPCFAQVCLHHTCLAFGAKDNLDVCCLHGEVLNGDGVYKLDILDL